MYERHMIIMIPHQNLKKKTNEVNESTINMMTVRYLITKYVISLHSTASIQQ